MIRRSPLRLFLLTYAVLIVVGTGLLLLPGTTVGSSLSLFEATFTAVSAVCLVGLAVVDTATRLTLLGQVVILLLIQSGVLSYLYFAVRTARTLRGASDHSSPQSVWKRVLTVTLLIEAGATGLIYYSGGGSLTEAYPPLFVSFFHAVSAFGNAGFSVLSENLYAVPRAFVLHLAIMVTFVLGGLGIDPLYDLGARKRLRQRMADPSIDWQPSTKISVNFSILLLGVGAGVFYGLEHNGSLRHLNLTEQLIGSVFQAATVRTAGFYTLDITVLTTTTLLTMILLMLIGGGAGSTAGGVKTITLYRVLFSTGKVRRVAYAVIGYALAVNIVGAVALLLTEANLPLAGLLFEQVSAFSSVGLSVVGTSTLSAGGQTVLLLSMLLGRVGVLALMMYAQGTHLQTPQSSSA